MCCQSCCLWVLLLCTFPGLPTVQFLVTCSILQVIITCSILQVIRNILQAIKIWTMGRPGNEDKSSYVLYSLLLCSTWVYIKTCMGKLWADPNSVYMTLWCCKLSSLSSQIWNHASGGNLAIYKSTICNPTSLEPVTFAFQLSTCSWTTY